MYKVIRMAGGPKVIPTFCLNCKFIIMLMPMQKGRHLKRPLMFKSFRKYYASQKKARGLEILLSSETLDMRQDTPAGRNLPWSKAKRAVCLKRTRSRSFENLHGLLLRLYGFRTWPPRAEYPVEWLDVRTEAHSLILACPRMIAPAPRKSETTWASLGT